MNCIRSFWSQGFVHFRHVSYLGTTIWPSTKLPFDCQKIAKNLPVAIFFKKWHFLSFFFEKISSFWQFFDSQMAILLKKIKILSIFLKKMSSYWQFFDIQMAIFRRVRWQLGDFASSPHILQIKSISFLLYTWYSLLNCKYYKLMKCVLYIPDSLCLTSFDASSQQFVEVSKCNIHAHHCHYFVWGTVCSHRSRNSGNICKQSC